MTLSKKIITTVVFIIFLCLLALGDYFLYTYFQKNSASSNDNIIIIETNSPEIIIEKNVIEKIDIALKNELNLIKKSTIQTNTFLGFDMNEPIERIIYSDSTENNDEAFLTLYFLPFSGHDIAVTKLLNIFRSQFKTEEADIFPYPLYGDQSWIIRLAKDQKKMYLVVAHEGRLLGIEYLLGENLSRHQLLESVFTPILKIQ